MPRDPFGPRRSWLHVQRAVEKKLHKTYWYLTEDQMQDIIGEVMLDLVDYWQRLPSSQYDEADPTRNYNYAIERGVWTGKREVVKLLQRLDHERVQRGIPAHYESGEDGYIDPLELIIDYETPLDVLAEEEDETERARRLLSELPQDELQQTFEDMATTERSEREEARYVGDGRGGERRARKRKAAAIARLRYRARRYGIS